MRKLIMVVLFMAAVSGLDAARDAGYGHEHWLRAPILWSDGYHFIKWTAFYGPLVYILAREYPLLQRVRHGTIVLWHNVAVWILCAIAGSIAWQAYVRLAEAPWLN
tara:strand:- start:2668 stop:2985 length:318 start_codon:yes stop_codon:yes gene_type:complete